MAAVLNNGDYTPDGKGGFAKDTGPLAEILFRLSCKRGGFALLPELGSRLHLLGQEKPSRRSAAARQFAMEALEDLNVTVEDAAVTLDENGTARVTVFLTAEGDRLQVEVTA